MKEYCNLHSLLPYNSHSNCGEYLSTQCLGEFKAFRQFSSIVKLINELIIKSTQDLIVGSYIFMHFRQWYNTAHNAAKPPITWEHQIVFLENNHSSLFCELFPAETFKISSLTHSLDSVAASIANISDIFFIPYSKLGNIIHWTHEIFGILASQFAAVMELIEVNL